MIPSPRRAPVRRRPRPRTAAGGRPGPSAPAGPRRARRLRRGPRPAFAQDRLAWTDDGGISYKLKRPWPDGRTPLVLPPVAFLRRTLGGAGWPPQLLGPVKKFGRAKVAAASLKASAKILENVRSSMHLEGSVLRTADALLKSKAA